MPGYTIGETAERSGFSASTLRYYEAIDLVRPARRNEAGYRVYDDTALARLAFIGRAKQLGCSLEEIRDLVTVWDDERCAPVQRRFHELVTAKLAEARHQMAELTAFTEQLAAAASRLAGAPNEGPCGDDCACATATSVQSAMSLPLKLAAIPVSRRSTEPISCTLTADASADRLTDWRAVLARSRSRVTTPTGSVRVEFDESVDVGELARLVTAEQQCCSFFAFTIAVDHRGAALEVDAPDDAADLVAAVFGPAH